MKIFLSYICFLFFTLGSFAQTQQDSLKVKHDTSSIEQKKFDTDNLGGYKADKDFNYEVEKRKPTLLERAWNWLKRGLLKVLSWLFGNKVATGILAIIVRILPYLIAGIVLFLLLKFFLKVKTNSIISGKMDKAIVSLNTEEELIKNEDLQTLIQQAIEQKNYRLAVRYYYLLALQKLTLNDTIDWQQEKTNEDYIKEIEQVNLKDRFISSTHLYDFVWYGNFDINALEFSKAEAEFMALNKLIK